MKISESQLRRIIREELNRSSLMKESFWGKVKNFGRGTIFGSGKKLDARRCFMAISQAEQEEMLTKKIQNYEFYQKLSSLSKEQLHSVGIASIDMIRSGCKFALLDSIDENERFSDLVSDLDPDDEKSQAELVKAFFNSKNITLTGDKFTDFYKKTIEPAIEKIDSMQRGRNFDRQFR